jgi:glutaredoxin 2
MKIFLFILSLLKFVVSVVEIQAPSELMKYFKDSTKKDSIPASYAHFGRIPYGYQIVFTHLP